MSIEADTAVRHALPTRPPGLRKESPADQDDNCEAGSNLGPPDSMRDGLLILVLAGAAPDAAVQEVLREAVISPARSTGSPRRRTRPATPRSSGAFAEGAAARKARSTAGLRRLRGVCTISWRAGTTHRSCLVIAADHHKGRARVLVPPR